MKNIIFIFFNSFSNEQKEIKIKVSDQILVFNPHCGKSYKISNESEKMIRIWQTFPIWANFLDNLPSERLLQMDSNGLTLAFFRIFSTSSSTSLAFSSQNALSSQSQEMKFLIDVLNCCYCRNERSKIHFFVVLK